MSEVPAVYRAINEVTAALAKSGVAKQKPHGAMYEARGIDQIYNALAPLLAEHKLCILPSVLDRTCEERQSGGGKALFYVTLQVDFDFVSAEDGSTHKVTTMGEAMDTSDKATNKAMSAAYKYAAMMAFCIPTIGEDSENDTHEVRPKAPIVHLPRAPNEITPLAIQLQNKLGDKDEWEPPRGPSLIPLREIDVITWGRRFIRAIRTSTNQFAIENWQTYNSTNLATLEAQAPTAYSLVQKEIQKLRAKIGPETLDESEIGAGMMSDGK